MKAAISWRGEGVSSEILVSLRAARVFSLEKSTLLGRRQRNQTFFGDVIARVDGIELDESLAPSQAGDDGGGMGRPAIPLP